MDDMYENYHEMRNSINYEIKFVKSQCYIFLHIYL